MDMNTALTPSVAKAVEQLRANFPKCPITVTPDGNGGAWFVLEGVPLGKPYANDTIWIGADLSPQLPYADVYPVFVSPDLKRIDGRLLGDATAQNVQFHGRNSVQISRRSNHRDAQRENPAVKILKVLAWLKSR